MGKKVLLVEDDKFITKAYTYALKKAGIEAEFASDGEEGLAKIKTFKPDLVLLDIMMPKKNGFEVLSDMQMDPELKKIPAVILSNLGQNTDVEKAKGLGAVDYLIKADHSLKEIVEKVKFYLAKS